MQPIDQLRTEILEHVKTWRDELQAMGIKKDDRLVQAVEGIYQAALQLHNEREIESLDYISRAILSNWTGRDA